MPIRPIFATFCGFNQEAVVNISKEPAGWRTNPWCLHGKEDILAAQKQSYYEYLQAVLSEEGFLQYFNQCGRRLTKTQIANKWGEEFSNKVFSQEKYFFIPSLMIQNEEIFDSVSSPVYSITVYNREIRFAVSGNDDTYPKEIELSDGKRTKKMKVLWNWAADNYQDYTYYMWEIFYKQRLLPYDPYNCDDENLVKDYSSFLFYEQTRFEQEKPDPNIMRVINLLDDMGYLETYNIRPEKPSPWFLFRGKPDGTIDMALLDMSFLRDTLIIEKIKLILSASEKDIAKYRYFITDSNGRQMLSERQGTLGGHRKLKIYGKLDCPSAKKHILKGNYIRHRVFFFDENTAKEAGYRPCGVCMKDEYTQWKIKKEENERMQELFDGLLNGIYQ